jgi:hypothetical protein
MATMMADADNSGATGTALLTLWKVGRVELPRITKVYQDALASLDSPRNADVTAPGEVFALWARPPPPRSGRAGGIAPRTGPAWMKRTGR